jgi:hypothetical protein
MTTVLQRVLLACSEPTDQSKPHITSMISTRDGRVVMSDSAHKKVKVVDMEVPHKVDASLELEETPCDLALLHDDLIALTTQSPLILLLKVC